MWVTESAARSCAVRVTRNHEWTGCSHAESAVFTAATFVPSLADIPSVSLTKTAFGLRNVLIGMSRAKDLRIRNAWVRGSNPLCGTSTHTFRNVLPISESMHPLSVRYPGLGACLSMARGSVNVSRPGAMKGFE